jgi:diadenosine tetraphosphatase ApaH/serine/threonine PP2A family protein phosphatase
MRAAVISDIHGNYHALEAVLAAIEAEAPDEVWCLGDLVGYGPQPNECVARVAALADVCLAGNHDLAVLGTIPIEDFSSDAAAAARWTQTVLDEPGRAYLERLEPTAEREGAQLFHGSPRDPVWDYVLTAESAYWSFRATTAQLVLVGHSHVALAISTGADDDLDGAPAPEGTEIELAGRRWLLNPGSVGQPRDGDPRAAWLLIDFDVGRAAFRRVPYPVEQTQAEIRARGLPEPLAARLAEGV